MKFIEQQLVAVLKETPPETECSVSVAVLDGFGLRGIELQAVWLDLHRPAQDNRAWYRVGDRWEYTASPSEPKIAPTPQPWSPASQPMAPNWQTTPTPAERLLSRIVVKPVVPFAAKKFVS